MLAINLEKIMPEVPLFQIQTAGKCAWRAFYVSIRKTDAGGWQYARQLAHLGIDPTSSRPAIFGGLWFFSFRIGIPFARGWHPNHSRARKAWSRWVHSLDGRF